MRRDLENYLEIKNSIIKLKHDYEVLKARKYLEAKSSNVAKLTENHLYSLTELDPDLIKLKENINEMTYDMDKLKLRILCDHIDLDKLFGGL